MCCHLISYLLWSPHWSLSNDRARTVCGRRRRCVYADAKFLWWELLTAPSWRRVVFSWHGSRSQNPWAPTADASTVPAPLNVLSRGKRHKCFYAFLVNVAWVSVFCTYAAAVAPRLQTQLKWVSTSRFCGIFSLNSRCSWQLIIKFKLRLLIALSG